MHPPFRSSHEEHRVFYFPHKIWREHPEAFMIAARICDVGELDTPDWTLWNDIVQSNPLLESPYFRPEFTRAVAAVRTDVKIARLSDGNRTIGFFPYQRGSLNIGKPIGGKLSDYHGLVVPTGMQVDPQDIVRQCGLAAWDFDHLIAQPAFESLAEVREESPYLDLSAGFQAYCQARKAAGSDVVAKTNQKARKCEREVGPLSFEFDCREPAVFELLKSWKSAQYLRTGLADVFAYEWTGHLLDRLRKFQSERLSTPLSVLRVNDKPACIALSLRSSGLLHCWFVAYDPDLAAYSPGQTFFLRFAEAAADEGVRKLDLGKGYERYKWSLASGGIPVWEGTVRRPSLSVWLRDTWRVARDWVNNSSALRATSEVPSRLIRPLREWMAYP
jgi:CelD/BcsL family acetyltransferase involved in cellulose biosynthesis